LWNRGVRPPRQGAPAWTRESRRPSPAIERRRCESKWRCPRRSDPALSRPLSNPRWDMTQGSRIASTSGNSRGATDAAVSRRATTAAPLSRPVAGRWPLSPPRAGATGLGRRLCRGAVAEQSAFILRHRRVNPHHPTVRAGCVVGPRRVRFGGRRCDGKTPGGTSFSKVSLYQGPPGLTAAHPTMGRACRYPYYASTRVA
jgi:hypothetical protein